MTSCWTNRHLVSKSLIIKHIVSFPCTVFILIFVKCTVCFVLMSLVEMGLVEQQPTYEQILCDIEQLVDGFSQEQLETLCCRLLDGQFCRI